MQNLDIKFENGRVSLSLETYNEFRLFAIRHGETDLPVEVMYVSDDGSPPLTEVIFPSKRKKLE